MGEIYLLYGKENDIFSLTSSGKSNPEIAKIKSELISITDEDNNTVPEFYKSGTILIILVERLQPIFLKCHDSDLLDLELLNLDGLEPTLQKFIQVCIKVQKHDDLYILYNFIQFVILCTISPNNCTLQMLYEFCDLHGLPVDGGTHIRLGYNGIRISYNLVASNLHEAFLFYRNPPDGENNFLEYKWNLKKKYNNPRLEPRPIDTNRTSDEYNKFNTIYRITNFQSLFIATLQELFKSKKVIKSCNYCNLLFIPENRADEIYCKRLITSGSKKTCEMLAKEKKRQQDEAEFPCKKVYKTIRTAFHKKFDTEIDEDEHELLTVKYEDFKCFGKALIAKVENNLMSNEECSKELNEYWKEVKKEAKERKKKLK